MNNCSAPPDPPHRHARQRNQTAYNYRDASLNAEAIAAFRSILLATKFILSPPRGGAQLLMGMNQWAERTLGIPLTRMADYLLGIPLLHALSITHSRRVWPADIRRVGVFCSPTTGDTVLFSAILQDLRNHFGPAVEIVHFVGQKNRSAAQLLAGADRLELIDLTRPLSARRQLRSEHLDAFFDFSSWQRITALLALTSRSRYTVGFRSAGQHRHIGYDQAVTHRSDQHELENFRDILRGVDIPVQAEPRVSVPEANLPEPWRTEPEVIVFHPWPAGGSLSLREWPASHWLALAQKLTRPGVIFAITGAPAQVPESRALAAYLAASPGVRAAAFEGEGGLIHLVHLLRKARLAVCVNTGIMHLAAIVGTPTVSLNGPTADHRWGPRGRCCVGVSPSDGSGGYLHLGFEISRSDVDVMSRIEPGQVADAAVTLLERCGQILPVKANVPSR